MGETTTIELFANDDAGFERWLEEHPEGYVLNIYRTGRVHTARCKSYRSHGEHMTHTRPKVVGGSERQLFEYAAQHHIDATRCELC